MITTLHAFLSRMIDRYEGGYVWDKADPGGPTKYGITAQALADFRGDKMTSHAAWASEVKAMDKSEAIKIYQKRYAPPVAYNDLPSGVDVTVLDYAVNSGPGRAVRVARRIVGLPDGTIMSPDVVRAIVKMPRADFINAMCDERLRFMQSLKGGAMWKRYGKGWNARVFDLRNYAKALSAGKIVPTGPDLSNVPTPKAEAEKGNKGATAGSTGAGGLFATIGGYLADLPWMWIAVAVGVVIAVGFAYGIYQDIRAAKEAKVHI